MKMSDKIESIFHATIPALMVLWIVLLFADLAKHGH
jgi:Na+/H+ antiporter NhaC